jgi:hypothetical protein
MPNPRILRFAIIAVASVVFPMTSQAQNCGGVVFNGEQYGGLATFWNGDSFFTYCVNNVPDLDQLRQTLPSNGGMYCAPTTATNWMLYLDQNGYPGIVPPSGDGNLFDYNYDTNLISSMGTMMGTSATNGTSGDGMYNGEIDWLSTYGPNYPLNVIVSWGSPNWNSPPVFSDMVNHAINDPGYIHAVIGWYCSNNDPNNPAAVYRCGGHVVALTEGSRDTRIIRKPLEAIGINDPDTPDTIGPPQSPFATEIYPGAEVTLQVASCPSGGPCPGAPTTALTMTNLVGFSSGNGYFDGALELQPVAGVSFAANTIYWLSSAGRSTVRFPVCYECSISSIAVESLQPGVDFLVEDADGVYRFNPLSKAVTQISSVAMGKFITVGGYRQSVYVQTPSSLIALAHDGHTLAKMELPLVDALAFDEASQRVVAFSRRERTLTFVSPDLKESSRRKLSEDPCEGSPEKATARVSVDNTNSTVWIRCDGSSDVVSIKGENVKGENIRRIALRGGESTTGLFVNGRHHVFVAKAGRVVELDAEGKAVADSYISGLPAGTEIQFTHDATNIDPRVLVGPAYFNVTPTQNAQRMAALHKPSPK